MTVQIFQPVGGGGGLTIGTTPITGGTTTRLLFDAAGVVSETDGATWDATNKALAVGGATVTTSNPVLNLSQTWNAGAVAFTALKLNVTNTASAAASLLLDLQVGGTSAFKIRKDGYTTFKGTSGLQIDTSDPGSATHTIQTTLNFVRFLNSGSSGWVNTSAERVGVGSQLTFGTFGGETATVIVTGPTTATLQQGAADAAAPVAQSLTVQSVVAGTSNTAGAAWTFKGSKGTGTGAGGSIIFQTAPAGSSGTAQNALATVLTLNSAGLATFAGPVKTLSTVVASLPAASTAGSGARAMVTDATATTFLSTVAGGGANIVPVVSDGTNWLIG